MSKELIDELDAAELRRKQQDRLYAVRDCCILAILSSFVIALLYYVGTRLG